MSSSTHTITLPYNHTTSTTTILAPTDNAKLYVLVVPVAHLFLRLIGFLASSTTLVNSPSASSGQYDRLTSFEDFDSSPFPEYFEGLSQAEDTEPIVSSEDPWFQFPVFPSDDRPADLEFPGPEPSEENLSAHLNGLLDIVSRLNDGLSEALQEVLVIENFVSEAMQVMVEEGERLARVSVGHTKVVTPGRIPVDGVDVELGDWDFEEDEDDEDKVEDMD